ncbi:hypothetical protein NQ317_019409 [Molorchus minor]|uniref:Major facilitator superfamily (MFS) profile domain-containing protein n=1 Tax=Molorchus minor TaxID=1323400 RepID=A0ABQ9JHS6_9CUCU|nr:hypothetical protein NQ317_019409 [Molorchus minor]
MVQNNAKVNTKLCVTKSVFYTMEKPQENDPATFEKAVVATGFGKFNVLLILLTLPPSFSKLFETASMSYVLPIAQCDLNLSLSDKGMLNAITFAGMITSGFVWGYLCDVSGRKKVMVFGYLLDGLFVLMASLSQNFNMLLISKFFGGLIINGPHSASTSYLSEFHASQYRARVQIARGIIASFGNIALPVLAWLILPQDLNFTIYEYIDVHSWNIFLFICSLWLL